MSNKSVMATQVRCQMTEENWLLVDAAMTVLKIERFRTCCSCLTLMWMIHQEQSGTSQRQSCRNIGRESGFKV